MEHFLHVDHLIHDLGLTDVSGNSVQYERVDVRLELVRRLPRQSIAARQSSTVISSGTSWPLLEYSRKALPTFVRVSMERKTSPQAQ